MAAAVEESAASSGGGGDGAGRRGSGLTGRERAAHWLDQLRDREAALGATPAEAPKTLDAWRDLLVDVTARMPRAYRGFHAKSSVARRVATGYGRAA